MAQPVPLVGAGCRICAVGLASCATPASSARSAVDASLGRTEAAGSAYFVRVNTMPGGATSTMEGSVNFARSELSMATYSGVPLVVHCRRRRPPGRY